MKVFRFTSTLLAVFLLLGLLLSSNAFASTTAEKLASCAKTAQSQNISPQSWMDADPTHDQILIDFDDALSNEDAIALGNAWGLKLRLNSPYSDAPNLFVAEVPEGAVPAFAECLKDNPEIEAIDENFRLKAFNTTPNDPLYQFQWNFDQVHAEKAWAHSTGKGVVVAVIDTGVALETDSARKIKAVKDLEDNNYVKGYDFVDDDDFPWDGHGHGTHVAGTIAQSTNNGYGVAGLAYDAKIMPLRVLNSEGYGSVADISDSIYFAAENGAQVINMSLGGPLPSLTMARAIQKAHKKGVTIIAAAGNSGRREVSYPAAYKHVIAVAATQFDRSTTFYSQWGSFVDIAAPGGNTRVDQNNDGRPDGVMQETLKNSNTNKHEFALYMGTSMASPHVAGIAALVVAQGVTNPEAVEKVLLSSTSDSERHRYDSEKEYREHYGAGIIMADKAAKNAKDAANPSRLAVALLLALGLFVGTRKRDLQPNVRQMALFGGAMVVASSGLFFLQSLLPASVATSAVGALMTQPLAFVPHTLLGAQYHQTALVASALLPLLALLFLGIRRSMKYLVAGLATGFAAYLFTDAVLMLSDVQWIPGVGILDRLWLVTQGLFALGIAMISLHRDE